MGQVCLGLCAARQLTDLGFKCLVIDKRNHIGGNCYTTQIDDIDVHMYGAHIFHTNYDYVWKYLNKHTSCNNYVNRVKTDSNGILYNTPPINLQTFYQLWGVKTSKEALRILENKKIKIDNPSNLEEFILSKVGEEIYYKFIYGYTLKQWGREPKLLPATIIKRVPIHLTFDDLYFSGQKQGIPCYNHLFINLLTNADIELNANFLDKKSYYENSGTHIIYTGKIDEYFEYCYGELEYRSLRFESKVLGVPDYQGCSVINYADKDIPYTRVLEHKYFNFSKSEKTVITREYPSSVGESYYPVNDEKNSRLYNRYKELSEKNYKISFVGRLGSYSYINMDETVKLALDLSYNLSGGSEC